MTTPIQASPEFPLSEQITRDYWIIRLLGKGGMGEVYLAEQLRVGRRQVALKVLNRACSENPETVRRFENEAASAGRINHRNVITVYESRITDDGQIYIAMEFIEGESLRDVIAERSPLPLETIIEITKQVCAGLAAAHRLGIVHRDMKPDNIMLTRQDGALVAKVLDFGIARLSETDSSGTKTRTGIVMGTPAYISPEQAAGYTGDRIDARSDIYSFGMVVYEMLTGHVAFEADSWMKMLYQHINEPPLPPSRLRSDLIIPEEVEQVVLKALEKDRANRQQTIIEFANELEAAYLQAKTAGAQATVDVSSKEVASNRTVTSYTTTPSVDAASLSPGQTIPAVRPEPQQPGDSTIVEANKKRKLMIFVGLLTLAAVIGAIAIFITHFSANKPEPISTPLLEGTVSPSSVSLLQYRIRLKEPKASLETLSAENIVHSGERVRFEFKPVRQGTLYFLGQDDNGSLVWLNPGSEPDAQAGRVGQWLNVPENDWIVMSTRPGRERFLAIYVPGNADWSLAKAASPATLSIK